MTVVVVYHLKGEWFVSEICRMQCEWFTTNQ